MQEISSGLRGPETGDNYDLMKLMKLLDNYHYNDDDHILFLHPHQCFEQSLHLPWRRRKHRSMPCRPFRS